MRLSSAAWRREVLRGALSEDNKLIIDAGGRLSVGDDGTVTWMNEDRPVRAPLQIEGFTPAMKRQVILLFLLLMRDY